MITNIYSPDHQPGLLFEINLFKQVREKIKYDLNVLSKVFHKRWFSFFICSEASDVRYFLKIYHGLTASFTLILRYAARLNKKQTNFFFKYVIVKD